MLACTYRFHSELQIRLKSLKEVAVKFDAIEAKLLISASQDEKKSSVPKFTSFNDEISENDLL